MKKILTLSVMFLFLGTLVSKAVGLNPATTHQIITSSISEKAKMSQLSQKLLNTQYKLNSALQKIRIHETTIASLNKTNDTLKKQKADLETQMLKNQQDTNTSYREEVRRYQIASNKSLDNTMDEFKAAKEKDQDARAAMEQKYESQIKAMREQYAANVSKSSDAQNQERADLTSSDEQRIANLNSSNNDLNAELVSTKKALEGATHQIAMDKETIQSLNTMISILTAQKKSIQDGLQQTLKETTDAYKKQIADINSKTQGQVNAFKASYESLKAVNNDATAKAKEDFINKLNITKKLYSNKLNALIAKVNSYEGGLNKAKKDISQNADQVDNIIRKLHEAYKYIPLSTLKKSGMGKIMKDIGLSSNSETSWEEVSKNVAALKDSLSSLDNITNQLNSENLNNRTILKKVNKNDSGKILGIF